MINFLFGTLETVFLFLFEKLSWQLQDKVGSNEKPIFLKRCSFSVLQRFQKELLLSKKVSFIGVLDGA